MAAPCRYTVRLLGLRSRSPIKQETEEYPRGSAQRITGGSTAAPVWE